LWAVLPFLAALVFLSGAATSDELKSQARSTSYQSVLEFRAVQRRAHSHKHVRHSSKSGQSEDGRVLNLLALRPS
jgi:hypothetical protein